VFPLFYKKISEGKNTQKKVSLIISHKSKYHNAYIIFEDPKQKKMKLEFDEFEKDLLIDTIRHRLDTDKVLVINNSLKEELTELLRKVEEDEYL
jgi:ribosome assembly protein YihI (activator of Der GTPase)